jgi:hypothetical protein
VTFAPASAGVFFAIGFRFSASNPQPAPDGGMNVGKHKITMPIILAFTVVFQIIMKTLFDSAPGTIVPFRHGLETSN